MTPTTETSATQYSAFREAVSSSSNSFSLGLPRTSSPPHLDRTLPPDSSTSSNRMRSQSHHPSSSLTSSSSITDIGPAVRPLDYTTLITTESTQAELARTIDDLSQWLSVVEIGLSSMLDMTYANTIEEEQEEGIPTDDEFDEIPTDESMEAEPVPMPLAANG